MAEHALNSPGYWETRFETGEWDAHDGPRQSRFFAEVALSLLPPGVKHDMRTRGCTVCDWGCAEGDGTAALAAAWRVPVTGLDVAPSAIERARVRHGSVEFVLGRDGLDRDYDVLFTSNTLEHFADPLAVLASLLPRVRRYAIVLVPFEERERDPEHAFTFEWESFPLAVGGFRLAALRVADVRSAPQSPWAGSQALAVYVRADAANPPVHLDAATAGLLRRAAELAAERDRHADERDRHAAEARRLRGAYETLHAAASEAAARLEAARAPRSYQAGRVLAGMRKAPAATAAAAARWLASSVQGDAVPEPALPAPDPLGDEAAALRDAIARARLGVKSS